MINSIIQALFNIKIQEKKRQRIYDLLKAKTKPKFLSTLYKVKFFF